MKKQFICSECGSAGKTKRDVKGNFAIEIILWFCFLIPGLIYSIWRQTTHHEACVVCGNTNLIPIDSPNGQKLIKEQGKTIEEVQTESAATDALKAQKMMRVLFWILALWAISFFIVQIVELIDRGNSNQIQITPQLPQNQPNATIPKVKKNFDYEIVESWNGDSFETIAIAPENVNEVDLTALGKKIRKEMSPNINSFVFIFSDRDAALAHGKVLATKAAAGDTNTFGSANAAFNDAHFVGNYQKNAEGGEHFFIYLNGYKGTSKEISY